MLEDARGGVRPVLPQDQMGSEVTGGPSGAQRGCVRARLVEQRAQRQALFSRVAHLMMVGVIATLAEGAQRALFRTGPAGTGLELVRTVGTGSRREPHSNLDDASA